MTTSKDDNPFLGTVQKAMKKPVPRPDEKSAAPQDTTDPQTRSSKTKEVHVQISQDKMLWVKDLAARNYWTQRTVFELALDALKEKLGD